jgi:hypothetical protein
MKCKHQDLFIPLPIPSLVFLFIVANYAAGQSGGSSPLPRDRHPGKKFYRLK